MEENSKEDGVGGSPASPHDPLPLPGSLGPGPQRALGRGLQTPIPEPEVGGRGPPPSQGVLGPSRSRPGVSPTVAAHGPPTLFPEATRAFWKAGTC